MIAVYSGFLEAVIVVVLSTNTTISCRSLFVFLFLSFIGNVALLFAIDIHVIFVLLLEIPETLFDKCSIELFDPIAGSIQIANNNTPKRSPIYKFLYHHVIMDLFTCDLQ